MKQWFRPMGLNLLVSTDTPTLTAAVHDAFSLFGPGDDTVPADLQFHFALTREDLSGEREYRMSPRGAELRIGNRVVLSIDSCSGTAHGSFPETLVSNRATFRLHVLHFALSAALSACGFLGVHAACIACNGKAVLLRGPHGSGKSVLTYAAAARGFQVIAGSTVWVAPGDQLWWGVPRWVYLRHSGRALFSGIPVCPEVCFSGEPKLEIDLARLYPASPVPFVHSGIVVNLKWQPGAAARLQLLPRNEAHQLWIKGAAGNEGSTTGYDERIATLLSKPSWKLSSGSADEIDRSLDLIAAAADGSGC